VALPFVSSLLLSPTLLGDSPQNARLRADVEISPAVVSQGSPVGEPSAVAGDAVDKDHAFLDVLIHMDEEVLADREAFAKLPANLGIDQIPGPADVR